MSSLFAELTAILVVSFIVSLFMNKIKQPMLVGYIFSGFIVGPIFFNLLSKPESFQIFSHIGVAFLLFIVGLQLNIKLIKEVGVISVVTGIGQIVFTTFFGILISVALGIGWIESIIIATALTFSSTIIIVKLLSDTKGLEQLYGKISLGFLLVQDFVAVLVLMIVGTVAKESGSMNTVIKTVLMGIATIILIFIAVKPIVQRLLEKIALQKELHFLFILAWCFGIAVLFEQIGFSLEIGALIAGISLASTQFQQEISGRIKPLRDFFIIMFFIFLGSQLIPAPDVPLEFGQQWSYISQALGPIVPQAIILSLFVIIGNPLIVLVLVTLFRYSARTGFLAGLTVSQISEFSIILVLLALDAGILTTMHLSLVTLVAIITITCSTYMVVHGDALYDFLRPLFKRLERKQVKDALQGVQGEKHQLGIFGYNRMGPQVLQEIKKTGLNYLIVDHDPAVVEKLKKKGVEVVLGDVSNAEFLSEFDFKDMEIIISTIPNARTNRSLLQNFKILNPLGISILTAEERWEAIELYDLGADYVIVPHHLGGNHIELLLREFAQNKQRFTQERKKHLAELHGRKYE